MPASFSSLPPEVVRLICEAIVPEPLATGTSDRLTPDYRARRKGIWSLCLTSHFYQSIASEFLYRTVAVTSFEQVLMLFRTWLSRLHVRRHMRSFACLCGKGELGVTEIAHGKWNRHESGVKCVRVDAKDKELFELLKLNLDPFIRIIYNLDRRAQDKAWLPFPGDGRDHAEDLLQRIVAAILCSADHLEDMLIQQPHGQTVPRLKALKQYLRLGMPDADDPTKSSWALDKVRIVRLQSDPEQGSSPGSSRSLWSSLRVSGLNPLQLPFFYFKEARRFELFDDNGAWYDLIYPRESSPDEPQKEAGLHALEDLRLYNSRTSSSFLGPLLYEAKSLEILHYTTRNQEWNLHPWDEYNHGTNSEMDPISMNEALLVAKDQLRELHLGSAVRAKDDGVAEYDTLEPILCLSHYTKLQRLAIDLRWILAPIEEGGARTLPLPFLLPSTLEELVLKETLSSYEIAIVSDSKIEERKHMLWMQTGLFTLYMSRKADRHFPTEPRQELERLQTVTFSAIRPFHDYEDCEKDYDLGEDYDSQGGIERHNGILKTPFGIKNLKSLFDMVNIKLRWKWQS